MLNHHERSSRRHLVWSLALALAGCGDSPESPVAPSTPVTDRPRPGEHTVSGTVLEAFGGMFRPAVGSRTIFFWVEQRQEPVGAMTVVAAGSKFTNANGHLPASVPDSRVSISAWSRAVLQPCLINTEVHADTLLNVQSYR